MSQNDAYFNRRGITKCGCGCTTMFHFDNFSISLTVLTVQNTERKLKKLGLTILYNTRAGFHYLVQMLFAFEGWSFLFNYNLPCPNPRPPSHPHLPPFWLFHPPSISIMSAIAHFVIEGSPKKWKFLLSHQDIICSSNFFRYCQINLRFM